MPRNEFDLLLKRMRTIMKDDVEMYELMDILPEDVEPEEEARLRLPYVSEPPIHEAEWAK